MRTAKQWVNLQRTAVACLCVVSATATPFAASRSPPRPPITTPTAAITEGTYGNIGVWPLPAGAAAIGDAPLNPMNFSILVFPEADPYLVEVAKRYTDVILYHPAPAAPPPASFHTLRLTVSDPSVRELQQDVDESYTLAFDATLSSATISAVTIFGARHGLETFSQLVTADRLSGVYHVAAMNISEAPRFTFRGLLIDAARHWLPPNLLLSLMDGMSFNKLNALQIGFGIDWSWTVESASFPNLTQQLTYGPEGTHLYSRDTIAWLVREAGYRGVRLIPYMEVVGHDALSGAVPDLFWCNGQQTRNGLPHPLHNATWEFFDALWADTKALFPEEYINIGGDEFDASCWENDPEINAWLSGNGYSNNTDWITALYYTRHFESLRRAGFKPLMFAEAFGPLNRTGVNLAGTDVIFDAWDEGTPGSAAPIIQAEGTRVIISSYCFLAPTQSCPDNLPGGLTPNWQSNYACEIQNATLFPPSAAPFLDRIVGGHPSRWGEETDGTNIFQFTWPAVMGAAEKLWTPAALTNGSLLPARAEVFAQHRCVLIRRGIPVQPTSTYSWSCDYEWEPAYPPLTPRNPNRAHSSWAVNQTVGADATSNAGADATSNAGAVTAACAHAPEHALSVKLSLRAELKAAQARIQDLESQLKVARSKRQPKSQ